MKSINRFIFPFLLVVLVSILLLFNFTPGTFLLGWDNLQTDFNIAVNLERALNVSWQEYQGLGLLGGMGHGADLIRQIILIPFSLVFNQNFLRYLWNFIALVTGVLGSYSLFIYLTKNKLSSFLGASFYLLNIGTIQNFYVTFEPFSAFFAFLPWLIYSLFKYLDTSDNKNLFLFLLFSLLGTTFAYVQTIFLVYVILLTIILLFYIFKKGIKSKKEKMLVSFKVLIIVLCANAFWLLPTSFFTLTNSVSTIVAKGNLMTTEPVFLRNNKFGNFLDLIQLKGYWFDYTDFDNFGNTIFLLDPWKIHLHNPFVQLISFSFFALLIIGVISFFLSKRISQKSRKYRYLLLILFLFCGCILLGANPPFTRIFNFLRENVPLFGQVFRSSFTKWIVPYSLFYSLLLTFGLSFIFSLFKKKIFKIMSALIFFVVLIFYSLPSFQGHFFYSHLRVKIPEAYFELFAYFKTVPASTRIANLPQHSFYGWQWNDWGYRGSGFLWYGIKQPILDRAFDVWSKADEDYYWQLQAALDKKDVKMLEAVFSKYDVDYLLLDTSIVNRNTVKPFNYAALKELLANSSRIKLVKEFDFINLYIFNDLENSCEKEFVTLYEPLPSIDNSYQYSWDDQAYLNFHDYLSVINNNANKATIIYPFASLFTNHQQQDFEFDLNEDQAFFYLGSHKTITNPDLKLKIPELLKTESVLPFRLTWQLEGNQLKLHLQALLPEIFYGSRKYYFDFNKEIILNAQLCQLNQQTPDCYLNINNQLFGVLSQSGQVDILLKTKTSNVLALSKANKIEYFDYSYFDLRSFDLTPKELLIRENINQENINFTVKIPKVVVQADVLKTELNTSQVKNCRPLAQGSVVKEQRVDGNYYEAKNASACDSFFLEQLSHQASYLFRLDAQNLRSIPFIFAIQVESLGRSPLETYLGEGVNYLILPPIENFNQGYTLYFSTDSYGREINDNLLKKAEVFAWPYNFLSQLYLQDQSEVVHQATFSSCDYQVKKKALWFYEVELLDGCQTQYLKLSQAYNPGWLAIQNGKLLDHEKFNNWANVWLLDETSKTAKIYLFFWPQLLQHSGFVLLVLTICLIHRSKK